MEEAAESLFESLDQIPDPRKARGGRHPFQAILRLTLLDLVSGQTTMAHIALFWETRWQRLKDLWALSGIRLPSKYNGRDA